MKTYKIFKKCKKLTIFGAGHITIAVALLMGCSNQQKEEASTHEDSNTPSVVVSAKKNIATVQAEDEGAKLTEAAGPAIVQALDDEIEPISDQSMLYVGRYHTEISCEDKFAHCEKGSAEFIINLLPNGTAHRTFVYRGRVSNDSHEDIINRNYKKNTWRYDAEHHQIVIQRVEGIQFFYTIDDQQNLVIDRDQILNASEINKRYFSGAGHHAPEENYVMTKF